MRRLSSDLEAVLVIGPNWIGDAVMSTPALANLRRGHPPGPSGPPAPRPGAAALADRLIASGGFRVVFFGSPDEAPLVELIRARMTREAVSLAGQDTLGSFMALAAR